MALRLPRFQQMAELTDDSGRPTAAFHVWWDTFATSLETNFNGLADTVQALADLNNDNILTPAKKPIWISQYTNLSGEQSDIDSKATSFGITTEKTNYDNAVSTLTSYLAGLTTPVAWNNLTGNTTIVGTTFRSNFNDVYSTKQLLLDKMHASSKTLADAAQTTANTGVTDAATAQTTANTVKRDDKISISTVIPANVLSAADVGSDCTITISAHSRRYGDATSLSVAGGTLTGAAYSTDYGIYYDDTTVLDTTPTYHKTTTLSNALNNYVAGRHFVGTITTPAAAGAATTGGQTPPASGAVDDTGRNKYNA